jgi:hypothetical protein
LFSQRRQKEWRRPIDLKRLFTEVLPVIEHLEEQLQAHE